MQLNTELRNINQFKHNWGWFLVWGLLFTVVGVAAILAATFTTWISILILGGILLGTGVVILINSFHYWWSKDSGFSWNFITGCLYAILGSLIILYPVIVANILALLIGCFFVVIGISRILYTQHYKLPGWGWNLFSGGLSLLLGILIVLQWPTTGEFILGLFIGIDLFFLGWSYIMLGFLARSIK